MKYKSTCIELEQATIEYFIEPLSSWTAIYLSKYIIDEDDYAEKLSVLCGELMLLVADDIARAIILKCVDKFYYLVETRTNNDYDKIKKY